MSDTEKMAPVQGYHSKIPWWLHLEAYAAYCKKWSPQPALIEGGCRGGFGMQELDEFVPGWRDRIEAFGKMKARVAECEALVAGANARVSVADRELQTIRAGHTKTVEYDLSPAMAETVIRDKLVELGWTPPAPAPRYTCIGKGGEYELVGTAYGAGTSRAHGLAYVYRDVATGQNFYRSEVDFGDRMQKLEVSHGS